MNHSLLHKFLGLAILAGVFLALTSSSDAAECSRSGSFTGTSARITEVSQAGGTRTQSFALVKEPVSTP